MQKLSGILLLVGAAIGFIGEGNPVVGTVYSTSDLQAQLAAIAANSGSWTTANVLMAAAGIVVALGLVLFAVQLKNLGVAKPVQTAAYVAAGLALLGALLHAIERYNIIANSWATFNPLPIPYAVAWIAGLIITGFVLLRSGYPRWLGWLLIVFSGLLLVGEIADFLPPVLIYIPLIVMSIRLLAKSPPTPARAEPAARIA